MSNVRAMFNSSFLVVTLAIGGVALPGSGNAEKVPSPAVQEPAAPSNEAQVLVLEKNTQDALSAQTGSKPHVLFVVDNEGALTVLRGNETSPPTPLKLPATIQDIFSITVIKTNPICWIDSTGGKQCVEP